MIPQTKHVLLFADLFKTPNVVLVGQWALEEI